MSKFNCFSQDVGRGVHNLNTAALKIELTNVAPVVTNTVIANITDITAEHGYSAGGSAIAAVAYSQTSGTGKLTGTDLVFTASGGSIGPFRYAVLYNSTASNGPLIGWWDYGSSITLATGETFTIDFDAANGILVIS
jgi:hypothetical protein